MTAADNFKDDWYGWLTNQWSHVVLGQIAFSVVMILSIMYYGEFCTRNAAWGIVAACYITWEVFTNKDGKYWDALEDFLFVCVYGAGWIAFAFREVKPGDMQFFGDFSMVLPIVGLFAAHTTLGVLFRVIGKARE